MPRDGDGTSHPLRLAIAGGGTGGHVLPALAVIEELRGRNRLGEALWIGSADGVEREAAARAEIPFRAIATGKLRRYLSGRTLIDAGRIPIGVAQARRLLRAFRPTVVFSTGGFVSVPTVVAAVRLAPVLTHEQTAILGLANRINARFADLFAVSWEETGDLARAIHRRVEVTGNPVRASLASGRSERAFAGWRFDPDLPLVYVTGGARGASPINRRLAAVLPDLLERCQVLHQIGAIGTEQDATSLAAAREGWSERHRRRYHAVEFVGDELADVYAAAALVVGRAGAGTVAELAVLGKPAVLIPLPGAGGDEQTRNARLLADVGAAVLLPQEEATPERLRQIMSDLLSDPGRLAAMGDRAKAVGRPGAAARLADELLALAARRSTSTGA